MLKIATKILKNSIVFIGAALVLPSVAMPQVAKESFTGCLGNYGCVFDITWDGWKGFLTLAPDGTGSLQHISAGKTFSLRHIVNINPQDDIDGNLGVGFRMPSKLFHRIVFYVDFNETPNIQDDDQLFDGYIMTQSQDALAGITWWKDIPFGFFANNKRAPLI